jgi:L-alanine-DL-glutamate epimerase-like enolase superfamily enzyme
MPPYLGESQETATAFLSKVNLEQFNDPFEIEKILDYVDSIAEKNTAAKASVDIALHDLVGKLMNQPWYKIWGYDKTKTPNTTFTIGIDTPDVVRQKVKEASEFKLLKVKLGKDNDKEMIETIRSVTDVPLLQMQIKAGKTNNMQWI